MRFLVALIALAGALAPPVAEAGGGRRRAAGPARPRDDRAAAATGSFHHDGVAGACGTGFLVARFGDRRSRRGLALTVGHNLPQGEADQAYLRFGGRTARVVRVVGVAGSERGSDHALVEVKLSRRLWNDGAAVLELDRGAPRGPVRVFGFPSGQAPRLVSRPGRAADRGRLQPVSFGEDLPVQVQAFDYPGDLGLSGGPVVSQRTGRAVAVHVGNELFADGSQRSYAVSVRRILSDLEWTVADPVARARVRALGRRSGKPPRE